MESQKFAQKWIESWNSHDLKEILNHYSDDIEITTPIIKMAGGINSGMLKGKKSVADYWEKALNINPGLHFEVINSFSGVNSVVIYCKGHRGLSAETFFFDNEGKVISAYAYYE